MKKYNQYVINKSGVKIYFIPLIMYPYSNNIWGCVKYGDTDIPAFDQVKINKRVDEEPEETKMHSDMTRYIITNFFENAQYRINIITGYKA